MGKIIVTTVALAVLASGLPAFAGPDLSSTIDAELTLEQVGSDIEIDVNVEGLTADVVFTVRAYVPQQPGLSPSSDCGAAPAVAFATSSDENGTLSITDLIPNRDLDEIGSVSIRRDLTVPGK